MDLVTFNYSSMVDVVFLFRWDNITHVITSCDIDFNMFWFDDLR